ncbi:hypothetical protein CEP51_010387 [Fusarium floridanum]|uniref:BZIP domain-containing protein n=1 Tax=Fusarium floridanum TaxID=1325733 RepID=A0A428REN7_9HYPO|nr:hypothetical protein CEP51_010387 [Fusarium floridanum]
MPQNNKPSRRPGKRKADPGPDGAERGRKRAQNRISQQCLREKNLAHVRSLEETVALLQQAVSSGDQGSRYATLLETHLKLMEENRRLQDALLRLRKKLLSLSNAASAAADDEVFGTVLWGSQDTTATPPADEGGHRDSPDSPQGLCAEGELICQQGSNTEPDAGSVTAQTRGAVDPGISDFQSLQNDPLQSYSDILSTWPVDGHDEVGLTIPLSTWMLPQDQIVVTSIALFGSKLLDACDKYIKRKSNSTLPDQVDEWNRKLVRVAISFGTRCMGLESYIYGVNGARYMEKVLSWRLGLEPKDKVPAPFRPTPLQSRQPTHFWGFDLFNWPELRDQLVLEHGSVDLDALTKDLVLHSVIEQPQRGVAVNVLDIFENQILRRDKSSCAQSGTCRNYLTDASWVLFEVGPEIQSMYGSVADPVEEAIIAELDRRMLNEEAMPRGCSESSLPSPGSYPGTDVAHFLGIDNFLGWRISQEFANKYPFLDCSTAISDYQLAPSTDLFCW